MRDVRGLRTLAHVRPTGEVFIDKVGDCVQESRSMLLGRTEESPIETSMGECAYQRTFAV